MAEASNRYEENGGARAAAGWNLRALTQPSTLFGANGMNAEMFLQDGFAAGVDDPGRCPDLGIVKGVYIVHQEVDKTPLLLKHR